MTFTPDGYNTAIVHTGTEFINSDSSAVQSLEFKNGEVISFRTLLGIWWLIHAGIKLIQVSKSALR